MATINGNFKVNGIPFADWFNQTFRLTNTQIYAYPVNTPNFVNLMGYIKDFTGKDAITLGEFCGHFAIMYNETGGTFSVIREMGGPKYMFNPTSWGKVTYNRSPNKLAGNQLKEWGVISSAADVAKWNSSAYPGNLPDNAQNRCDFYRFRGYGYNQLTWRNNYEKFMNPVLQELYQKNIDDYNPVDFEVAIKNLTVATKTFHNFISLGSNAQQAIADLEKGDFRAYGMLVSGGWVSYVNTKYIPRALNLYNKLKTMTITHEGSAANSRQTTHAPPKYAIDGMHLTPQQIKIIQQAIASSGNKEATELVGGSGRADGLWGNDTEKAFKLVGKTIKELLNTSDEKHISPVSGMNKVEVKAAQQTVIDSGNLIAYSGGADGLWGKESQDAFDKLSGLLKESAATITKVRESIDDLPKDQIKDIQQTIMNAGNLIIKNGGADGFWGDASETAFNKLEQEWEKLSATPVVNSK